MASSSEQNDDFKVKELISLMTFKWSELKLICETGKREILAEARSNK